MRRARSSQKTTSLTCRASIHSSEGLNGSGAVTGPASLFDASRVRSIERECDNVVAAAKVDLGVPAGADYDILLAAHHVGGGWSINSCTGAEIPQFLAVGRIIGGELAVALTRENKTA